ncbi:MAG TPA: hypothetical protein DDW51_12040 [Cyanobacteria bacterium UBA11367]|nr:hypothetical protein [Cyanobacteria bacterium UBA11367]
MTSLSVTCSENSKGNIVQENISLRAELLRTQEIIKKLCTEIEILKKGNAKIVTPIEEEYVRYSTDEDQLERDTDWILKENKKRRAKKAKIESEKSQKRKAESSPEADISLKIVENNSKKDERPASQENNVKIPKIKPPPPINITNVDSFHVIRGILMEATKGEYKLIAMNNNTWKINLPDADSYRNLTNQLNEKGLKWYTYEDKNTRPIKIVARGLHHSCSTDEIVEDLKSKNRKIVDAVNIFTTERKVNSKGERIINKRPLPLFILSFENSEKIEEIFNISNILGMRVRIEPLKKATGIIPQCKKCQAYNHTQKYCNQDSRCVKCTGQHDTRNCTIASNTPATCVNCRGNHPASYRGCEVAKVLQAQRNKTLNKQKAATKSALSSKKVTETLSFAKVANTGLANRTEIKKVDTPTNDLKQIIIGMQNTLNLVVNRLGDLDAKIENINQRQNVLEQQQAKHIESFEIFKKGQNENNIKYNKNFEVIRENYKRK